MAKGSNGNSDTNVSLDVQTGAPPKGGVWKQCKNGQGNDINYCYKYTGGDWPAGGEEPGGPGYFQAETGNGAKTVHISLEASQIWQPNNPNSWGFRIIEIEIAPPGSNCSAQGNAANQRQIVDTATDDQAGTYTVTVGYKSEDGTTTDLDIVCDPGWRNTGGSGM